MSRPSMTTLPSESVHATQNVEHRRLARADAPRMMASSPFSMPKLTSSFAVMVVEPIW